MPISILAIAIATAVAQSDPSAQLADMKGQIQASCGIAVAKAPNGVPSGFCKCFSDATAADAVALKPQDRALFLIVTQHAGDPIAAQKEAQLRLQVDMPQFTVAWDKLNPIGAKAGQACSKGAAQ